MDFIFESLNHFPELGRLYNPLLEIRRIINSKTRYNIYYIIKEDVIYFLYIIDGEMNLNQDIEDNSFGLPKLDILRASWNRGTRNV